MSKDNNPFDHKYDTSEYVILDGLERPCCKNRYALKEAFKKMLDCLYLAGRDKDHYQAHFRIDPQTYDEWKKLLE